MKLFWGDYHKATRHLTRDQHGAYFLLIGEAWRLGGALPDDDAKLAAWALCTNEEWAAMKPVILDFFALRRGRWWHDRVREELAVYKSTSRKRKEAGKKGGSARPALIRENKEANASLLPPKPEPEPESKKELFPLPPEGAKKRAPRGRVSIPDGFPDTEALKVARDMVVAAGVAIHVRTEADKMRDWAIGKGEKKADWMAAWRNWIRMACERAPALGLVQREVQTEHDPWPMRVRAWINDTGWNHVDWGPEPFERGCKVPAHHLPPRAAE